MSSLSMFSLPFNRWGATDFEYSFLVPEDTVVFIKPKRKLMIGRYAYYKIMFDIVYAPKNTGSRYLGTSSYPLDHVDDAVKECSKIAMMFIEARINAMANAALQPTPKEQIDFILENGIIMPNQIFVDSNGI